MKTGTPSPVSSQVLSFLLADCSWLLHRPPLKFSTWNQTRGRRSLHRRRRTTIVIVQNRPW